MSYICPNDKENMYSSDELVQDIYARLVVCKYELESSLEKEAKMQSTQMQFTYDVEDIDNMTINAAKYEEHLLTRYHYIPACESQVCTFTKHHEKYLELFSHSPL